MATVLNFNSRDKVIVRKPKNLGEFPVWLPTDMDRYNGTLQTVSHTHNGYGLVYLEGIHWGFSPRWLQPCDVSVQATSFNLCDVVQHDGGKYVILSRRGGRLQCCTVEAYCEDSTSYNLKHPERWRGVCLEWESVSSLNPKDVQFFCTYSKAIEDGLIKPDLGDWYE